MPLSSVSFVSFCVKIDPTEAGRWDIPKIAEFPIKIWALYRCCQPSYAKPSDREAL